MKERKDDHTTFLEQLGIRTVIIGGFVSIFGAMVLLTLHVGSRASLSDITKVESKIRQAIDNSKQRDEKIKDQARGFAERNRELLAKARENLRAYTNASILRAVSAHESKNAHHGVNAMIMRYAPSLVDHVHLKSRVEQMERQNAEWKRELNTSLREIQGSLKELSERIPRLHRSGRRLQSTP